VDNNLSVCQLCNTAPDTQGKKPHLPILDADRKNVVAKQQKSLST
jgi:hypothetical protein